MDMGGMHEVALPSNVDAVGIALRLVLLFTTAVVAGTSLMRPSIHSLGPRTRLIAWIAAVIAAVAAVSSTFVSGANTSFAVAHAVLVLLLPVVLSFSTVSSWLGAVLGLVVLAETSLGSSPFEFLLDLLITAAALVWLGMTVLTTTVPEEQRRSVWLEAVPIAVSAVTVLSGASLVRLLTSDVAFDRRLYESSYGQLLAVLVVVSLAAVASTVWMLRRGAKGRVYQVGVLAVAAAVLASTALPAIARPPELPTPGIPLLAQSQLGQYSVPVLVTPQRPGTNLVHFPESAGSGLSVRASGQTVPAVSRPGSTGTWAEVELPRGRSELVITHGGMQGSHGGMQGSHGEMASSHGEMEGSHEGMEASVSVDTGTDSGFASATGPDGPECASSALGSLVSGAREVLTDCPSDRLTDNDTDALRKLVGFISAHGTQSLSVVASDSPRSQQAAETIRAAGKNMDVTVNSEPQQAEALLVVSGWGSAAQTLEKAKQQGAENPAAAYSRGIYLAPWLLHQPILKSVASTFLPLRFDPRENRSLKYGMTLSSKFGGEPPSVAGFRRWVSETGDDTKGPLAVYAAAQVDVMKMQMGGMKMTMHGSPPVGQWNPRGTIVAISNPLR